LHTLREVKLLETHPGLRRDLALLTQASYCALLIEQTTETEAPLGALFDQFRSLLRALPQQPARPQTIFAFEMKLLDGLGLKPNLAETKLSAGARQILERMAELEWDAVFRLRLSAAQAEEIRQFLHGFLVYHLEKIPRGRSAALGGDGSGRST
jgi:hypothetical protein